MKETEYSIVSNRAKLQAAMVILRDVDRSDNLRDAMKFLDAEYLAMVERTPELEEEE